MQGSALGWSLAVAALHRYGRALKWACARPSRSSQCFFVVVVLSLPVVLAWIVLGFLARLTAADPCTVMESALAKLARQSEGLKPLPKIIHQQWKTAEVPAKFSSYYEEFKRLFPAPEYKHEMWTDARMRDLIATKFPWFLEAYDGYAYPIQRADAVRYFILYAYGGLYADLDYEPLANFWSALPVDRPAFIESPYRYNELTQNSLMSSPRGHVFWNRTFDLLLARAGSLQILTSTGPSFVDAALLQAQQGKPAVDTYVLPCENFHRIPVGKAGEDAPLLVVWFRNFMSTSFLVRQCGSVTNPQCQYGIHHNSVSWWSTSGVIPL